MIPLNKPLPRNSEYYSSNLYNEGVKEYCDQHFKNQIFYLLYSSRIGLQLIYQHLFKTRGSLKVGVSPLTCFDALLPIINNNHKIVFIDIDPETFNLDEKQLNSVENIDVIQPIHLGGNPQRMDIINNWAIKNGVVIIEDCAQAIGSFYDGKHMGSWGDFSVFSLTKTIQSTAGSLMVSREKIDFKIENHLPYSLAIYKKIKRLLESKCSYHKVNPYNLLYWLLLNIKERGGDNKTYRTFNLPMTFIDEIDKAITNANIINDKRLEVTNRLIENFNPSKFFVQKITENGISNRNRLLVMSKSVEAKLIIRKLRENGIAANNLTQNYLNGFQQTVWKSIFFEANYSSASLKNYDLVHPFLFSIPNSPALSEYEVNHIIRAINHI